MRGTFHIGYSESENKYHMLHIKGHTMVIIPPTFGFNLLGYVSTNTPDTIVDMDEWRGVSMEIMPESLHGYLWEQMRKH